jgi:hypothetical protein
MKFAFSADPSDFNLPRCQKPISYQIVRRGEPVLLLECDDDSRCALSSRTPLKSRDDALPVGPLILET